MLENFEMEHFAEVEQDGFQAGGVPKHWHLYDIVARKERNEYVIPMRGHNAACIAKRAGTLFINAGCLKLSENGYV